MNQPVCYSNGSERPNTDPFGVEEEEQIMTLRRLTLRRRTAQMRSFPSRRAQPGTLQTLPEAPLSADQVSVQAESSGPTIAEPRVRPLPHARHDPGRPHTHRKIPQSFRTPPWVQVPPFASPQPEPMPVPEPSTAQA